MIKYIHRIIYLTTIIIKDNLNILKSYIDK